MDKSLKISRSTEKDNIKILTLLEEAKNSNLTLEERSKQGFIQGEIDATLLAKFQNGLGVYIAKIDDELAGVAFMSKVGITNEGPIVEAVNTVLNMYKELSAQDIFQYGPVAVNPDFKGKGILTQMLLYICSTVGKDFKKGLAFVDEDNHLSLAIHRRYFEKESTTFLYQKKKYYAFLFNTRTLLEKYGEDIC